MRALYAVSISLLLAACDSRDATVNHMTTQSGKDVWTAELGKPQGAGTMSLPSGKQIKVLGIRKLAFAKGPPALMFSYQTDLSIEDKAALQREADEIWPVLRPDVEKAGLTAAVISANENPTGGVVKQNRGYNFVFEKSPDGRWSQLQNPRDKGPQNAG